MKQSESISDQDNQLLEIPWNYAVMDDWQIELKNLVYEIIDVKTNKKQVNKLIQNFILLCGRQVGKSEIVAWAIATILLNIRGLRLMIVSGVERQASGLYNKVLGYIEINFKTELKKGKDKPLRTVLKLKNKSVLRTEPIGLDGSGARQHTLDGVIFEEMQLIPEDAFAAITPMLLTTGGFIWMLGTAWDTEGYVYERLSDQDFHVIRVNAEEVAEKRPEPQRTIMLVHLEKERKRLSEAMYMQEYLAIPSAKTRQIFSDELIKRTLTSIRKAINHYNEHILGLDPAGLGEDEGSISIFEDEEDIFSQRDQIMTRKLHTTQTTEKVIMLDSQYDFKRIYLDDGGVGFGVFSELLADGQTKNKTIALNNASRPIDGDGKKTTHILGEEMIFHLLTMMERGKIRLLPDAEVRESLKSYRFEYNDNRKLIVTSTYNHPVQSIMRAAWHKQGKSLKLCVHTIKV